MKDYTKDDVMRAVKIAFPNDKAEDVLKVLCSVGAGLKSERVQLAIIKNSKGDREKLRENVNLANIDYRDVLMEAEYNQDKSRKKDPYKELGVEG